MIRRWEFIPGFEEYMITDQGEVFRYSKIKDSKGGVYRIVSLSKDGKKHSITVHRLVLEAFVGPRPDGCVAHHKDRNCTNNALSNLEWATRSEHSRLHPRSATYDRYDAFYGKNERKLGPKKIACGVTCDDPYRGERVSGAKLTESKVKLIRMLCACEWLRFTADELAKLFDVTQGTISKIVNYRTWAHVT